MDTATAIGGPLGVVLSSHSMSLDGFVVQRLGGVTHLSYRVVTKEAP
jgi:hypothetical protein